MQTLERFHLFIIKEYRKPMTYSETFEILQEEKVIDFGLAKELKDIESFVGIIEKEI